MKFALGFLFITFSAGADDCALWNASIFTLADKSDWVVIGSVAGEKAEAGQIRYIIRAKEVLKGNKKQKKFLSGLYIKSSRRSMVNKTPSCVASVKLEHGRDYIFFSEPRNTSSITEATEENKRLIKDFLLK